MKTLIKIFLTIAIIIAFAFVFAILKFAPFEFGLKMFCHILNLGLTILGISLTWKKL